MSTLREILTSELGKIPGIEKKLLPDHPGFTFFEYMGKGIAHFDTDFELDLKLTKAKIAREGLEHPKDSTNHPNRFRTKPNWIVLPFKTKTDVDEILRLVRIATHLE
jgi:hypothetical protein